MSGTGGESGAGPGWPRRLDRWATILLGIAVGGLMAFLAVLVLAQVVLRYVAGGGLLWSDEVIVLAMLWLAWLGAPYAWLTGNHIAVALFPRPRAMEASTQTVAIVGGGLLIFAADRTVALFGSLLMTTLPATAAIKYHPVMAGGALLVLAGCLNLAILFGDGRARR